MKKKMFATCRSKTNPRTGFWCMSILLLIVAFPIAGLSQDPADNVPSKIAYWNGGVGSWFGSGGSSNWVCEVKGSEYNCKPPSSAAWTAIVGAAGPNLAGSATLTLRTPVTVGALLIGDGTNGNVYITGSKNGKPTLTATTIVVGVTHSGSTPNPDTMNIGGGGIVDDVNGYIGDHGTAGVKWSNGVVTVTGAGSQWNNSGLLEVGINGNGTLNISNGASVTAAIGIVGANGPSTGMVTLTGVGSSFNSGQFLDVGLNGRGILTVNGGTTAAASMIQIGATGKVNVLGTGGTLAGNVYNYGTLDPITTANITGNYTAGMGGNTIFDISGKNSYGQLDVTGNVVLGGTLTLDFTNPNFRPVKGETFDFINAASFTNAGYTVDLIGCKNCNFSEVFSGGELTITSLNTPAEPETLVLLAMSLIAVAVFVGRMRHSILPDLRI
jgi:T5SS/PEP-CTERM-associated repeat protein